MLAEGSIHLTGLLLLAPHLTAANHGELLPRARFRTKREIERLLSEVLPRPDVPARIEPLGPRPARPESRWQAYMQALRGPVRELDAGVGPEQAPPALFEEPEHADGASHANSPRPAPAQARTSQDPVVPLRYRVEFTASQKHVNLLEEARDLLRHQLPGSDIARVHELALAAFVERLRKRRYAAKADSQKPSAAAQALENPRNAPAEAAAEQANSEPAVARVERSAPARIQATAATRSIPAAIRRGVWQRDGGTCTFTDERGRRCREHAALEFHHERPFARGGPTTLENLRLLCRAHNGLHAERDFGREHVERKKTGGLALTRPGLG
jgi:5-methylcytosine-specific restriction endonuclease McrA